MLSERPSGVPARAGHTDIRRNNLEVVLRHLWATGPDSRAGLAARAGLTRATVSRLVGELIGLGLVEETGAATARSGHGRPGTELRLAGRHVLAIGAEINVDYLTMLVADLANRQVHRWHRPFDTPRAGAEAALRALAEACAAWLDSLPAAPGSGRDPLVAGLGVAIPGLVDERRGIVGRAPNLGWDGVPVAELLSGLLAARLGDRVGPVTVGNEANRAALAEYRVGSHAGTPHLVYITGDVGIGGGLIVDGRPLLGARGYSGEVGHMLVDPAGPACGCGRRGCWEALVGLQALLAAVGEPPAGAASSSEESVGRVARRAGRGDPAVLAALSRLGEDIGTGCANVAALFDPEVIVLGGYFTAVAPWIMPSARTAYRDRLLAAPGPPAAAGGLAVSALGFSAAARGAATHIIDRVISDPRLLLAPRGG
ncbi:ROK family transcriptional regulator [Phaeacidiphilus oryzae]|uniref:ROK family transcriptional regulator n=1 Tax=Phaeacidiphilus oryzae TaxID=348818 RepID=UPI0007C8217C|nr:ROK family transcriptional regulator [Phaeacidiphilus oryzae]